jgi:hypothetical protein
MLTVEVRMSSPNQPEKRPEKALEHVSKAHELLNSLRERVGEHPELREAIVNLEMALSVLTVKTGGLL